MEICDHQYFVELEAFSLVQPQWLVSGSHESA